MVRDVKHALTITQTMVDKASPQANKIAGAIEDEGKRVSATQERMSISFRAAATAAAGAASAILAYTHQQGVAGDEIGKTSRKLGIGAETLQEWRKAADDSGASAKSVDIAIRSLGRRSALAAAGNKEYGKSFKALGVSVTNADGSLRDVEELLPEIADGMARMTSDGERTAAAMATMGDGGNELIPMLAGGAAGLQEMTDKARELGGVIDGETIQASEDYVQALGDLQFAVKGLGNSIGDNLIPALTTAATFWTRQIKQMSDWVDGANDVASVLSEVTEKGLKPQIAQLNELIKVRQQEQASAEADAERKSELFDEIVVLQKRRIVLERQLGDRVQEERKRADTARQRQQEQEAKDATRAATKKATDLKRIRAKARADRKRADAKAAADEQRALDAQLRDHEQAWKRWAANVTKIQKAAADRQEEIRQALADRRDQDLQAEATAAEAKGKMLEDLAEKDAELLQERIDNAQEYADAAIDLSADVASAIGSNLASVIAREQSFKEAREALWEDAKARGISIIMEVAAAQAKAAVGRLLASAITKQAIQDEMAAEVAGAATKKATAASNLAASTAEAAGETASANMGIPFVGLAVTAAAIAGMVALLAKFKGFAQGGLVEGGTPGRDSVPAMLTPGELVLPVHVARQVLSVARTSAAQPAQSDSRVQSASAPAPMQQTVVVQAKFQSMIAPTSVQQRRVTRDMSRHLERLGKRRAIAAGRR